MKAIHKQTKKLAKDISANQARKPKSALRGSVLAPTDQKSIGKKLNIDDVEKGAKVIIDNYGKPRNRIKLSSQPYIPQPCAPGFSNF